MATTRDARALSPVTRPFAALLLGLAAGLAAAAPVSAQAPDDPAQLEPVVVTVTRMEQKAGDAPASVTVLTRDDMHFSGTQTVDDLLRQVPGFSLFRRSSSLVTHPTTQGVSLRGIGPSGTSRALVLFDGVPANDAFGGWVYWGRIPMLGVEQIEVVRGGGSSVWGNYALGGVVQVLSRRPTERGLFFDASYGTQETMNFDLLLHEAAGPFRISLEGNYFSTDGYDVVKASRRGSIDIEADSNHSTFNGRVELLATPEASFFVSGFYYYEERGNGTPLQFNNTGTGGGAIGGRLGTLETRRMALRGLRRHAGVPQHLLLAGGRPELGDPGARPASAVDLRGRQPPVEPPLRRSPRRRRRRCALGEGRDRRARVQRRRVRPHARCRRPAIHRRPLPAGRVHADPVAGDRRRPSGRLLVQLRRHAARHAARRGRPGRADLQRHRADHPERAAGRPLPRHAHHRAARLRLSELPRADPERAVPGLPRSQRRDRRQLIAAPRAAHRRRARRAAALGTVRGTDHRLLERRARPDRERDAQHESLRLPGRNDVPAAPEPRPRAHPRHRGRDGSAPRPRLAVPRELSVRRRARGERAAAARASRASGWRRSPRTPSPPACASRGRPGSTRR